MGNFQKSIFLNHFIPLLAINYTVNPAARLHIIYFLYRLSVQIAPQATAKPVYLSNSAKAQANSALQFLGNIALRGYLIKYHNAQTSPHRSEDQRIAEKEFLSGIEAIDSSFKGLPLAPENTDLWRAQLASGSDEDKITALGNLHRIAFLDSKLLLGMLKNASLKLQKTIVPILGNNAMLLPKIGTIVFCSLRLAFFSMPSNSLESRKAILCRFPRGGYFIFIATRGQLSPTTVLFPGQWQSFE